MAQWAGVAPIDGVDGLAFDAGADARAPSGHGGAMPYSGPYSGTQFRADPIPSGFKLIRFRALILYL